MTLLHQSLYILSHEAIHYDVHHHFYFLGFRLCNHSCRIFCDNYKLRLTHYHVGYKCVAFYTCLWKDIDCVKSYSLRAESIISSPMVFSSATFLLAFMPPFFAAYFLVSGRVAKNVLLLVASLFFYSWGEPIYVLLLLISIMVNWALGIAIAMRCPPIAASEADVKPNGGKGVLAIAVVFNIALIGFFKYEGFLADTVGGIIGMPLIPKLELPLPIGISFYTLQALSYVIDIYRGKVEPQRNPLYLGMYIACFPQLIAGPIVRYETIQIQILDRKESLSDAADGMRLFIIGLAKKTLLANTCAILADKMLDMGGANIGAIGAWAGVIAYYFQIYFDFSGYSDMAIGLGRMMGFEYLRNFNYPYIARSVTEFWRRWHISLSTFFRDYLYIPLGGNRCSAMRWVFNLMVVWSITGLWHGASWNFVLWGLYYGVLLICEKLVWGKALARAPRIVGHLYATVIVLLGWTLFWITDLSQLTIYWQAMAGAFGATGSSSLWRLTAWEYWPMLIICTITATPIAPFCKERLYAYIEKRSAMSILEQGVLNPKCYSSEGLAALNAAPATVARTRVMHAAQVLYDLFLLALLLASIASIVSGSFNPFIYFQF